MQIFHCDNRAGVATARSPPPGTWVPAQAVETQGIQTILHSPGKLKRIFAKKRKAFEKSNQPLPHDTVTRLNKLNQDFGVLQTIANKARGQARAAERQQFDDTR